MASQAILADFKAETSVQNADAAGIIDRISASLAGVANAPPLGSSQSVVRSFMSKELQSMNVQQLVGEGASAESISQATSVIAQLRDEAADPASTIFAGPPDAAGSQTTRVPADDGPSVKRARFENASDIGSGAGASSGAEGSSSNSSSSNSSAAADAPKGFVSREDNARKEEESGSLQFRVVRNDGVRAHMIWLTQVKNIFATQLPKMPREYIARLVFDRKHRSLLAVKRDRVVGGICFRPFVSQRFAEIAFCAITSSEQVKGYGTRLMNHLKEAVKLDGLTHFLTYADNYAIGYFRKQGFTKQISMAHDRWVGYIKDYDGGTLMECCILQNVNYLAVPELVAEQRSEVMRRINERPVATAVHPPLDWSQAVTGGAADHYLRNLASIPGLTQAGWNPESIVTRRRETDLGGMSTALLAFADQMIAHDDSWPFRDAVDLSVVPDYLSVVKEPMDLGTLRANALAVRYRSLEHFLGDVERIFANCRKYNRPDTEYVACSNKLETFVKSRKAQLEAAVAATQPSSAA